MVRLALAVALLVPACIAGEVAPEDQADSTGASVEVDPKAAAPAVEEPRAARQARPASSALPARAERAEHWRQSCPGGCREVTHEDLLTDDGFGDLDLSLEPPPNPWHTK